VTLWLPGVRGTIPPLPRDQMEARGPL